jgi:RNA polymerase sigma-70 factor (ECF subfamily)
MKFRVRIGSVGESMYSYLPILKFAADGGHGETALPGYVSLFAGAEHGCWKRRNDIVELYDGLRPSLLGYLGCLGLSTDEAEDVIQECFLRLMHHLLRNRGEQNLRGWVFRVAHNLAMDLFRSSRSVGLESVLNEETRLREVADSSLSPEELAMQREEVRRVKEAITHLTPRQRYAVLLRAEGLRYHEISSVLHISAQSVGELLQRALARLAGDL